MNKYLGSWTLSPDRRLVATGSDDGSALVGDARTGSVLMSLGGKNGAVRGEAWSPDGKRLATATDDGTVQVYAMDIRDLMDLASRRITAHPSDAGCQMYFRIAKCPPMPKLSGW